MKSARYIITAMGVALLVAGSPAFAQRGAGQPEGVVRQGIATERTDISGTLVDIKEGPCEHTTGRAYIGMHYFLRTADGTVANVHLGPAESMKDMGLPTELGKTVTARTFRTENLKDHNYVAIEVTVDDETYVLRDADLKPLWSFGGRGGRGSRAAWWRR